MKNDEKSKATGELTRKLAHEIRNPLTNISLATEQLKEMTAQDPDISVLVEMINRNALRINQLLAEYLKKSENEI